MKPVFIEVTWANYLGDRRVLIAVASITSIEEDYEVPDRPRELVAINYADKSISVRESYSAVRSLLGRPIAPEPIAEGDADAAQHPGGQPIDHLSGHSMEESQ